METKTLRDYLKIIFRHKAVILVSAIAVIVATYIKVQTVTPYYTASVRLLISAEKIVESEYYQGIGMGRQVGTHTSLIKSLPVLSRVVESLKLYQRSLDFNELQLASSLRKIFINKELKAIKNQMEAMTSQEKNNFLFEHALMKLDSSAEMLIVEKTTMLDIIVKDYNSEMAVAIANALSRSYIIFDLEQQVKDLQLKYGDKNNIVARLKNYIEELKTTLDGKVHSDMEALGLPTMKIVSQAQYSSFTEPINKKAAIAMAVVAGIFLGMIIAISIDLLDQTFKSPQEIENILHIPFIGSIPKRKVKKDLMISNINPASTQYARSYQNISDQIYLLIKDKQLKSLLLIDAEGSNSTAAIIANLGISLANKADNKVLVIDANLRNPSISKAFGISHSPGLTDVLEQKIDFMGAIKEFTANLYILPSGETEFNPMILLESSMFSELIEEAKEFYNIILVSCADIRNYSDAAILSSKIDGILLVVNEGKVRRQVVKGALATLEKKRVNVVGAILNNRTHSLPGIIYKLT